MPLHYFSKYLRALIVGAFVFPQLAQANVSCTGPVTYLGTDQYGQVFVAVGTGINAIFSTVAQGSYQASPQACKLFYATLLADQLAGKSPTVLYNDPAITQCSQITAWTPQPSAYFVASN
jgi:hypothetical protein